MHYADIHQLYSIKIRLLKCTIRGIMYNRYTYYFMTKCKTALRQYYDESSWESQHCERPEFPVNIR